MKAYHEKVETLYCKGARTMGNFKVGDQVYLISYPDVVMVVIGLDPITLDLAWFNGGSLEEATLPKEVLVKVED